jgi:predicted TIM-barrel fold metal-dependent hydrolase
MIIDVHYHLMPAVNEETAARIARYAVRAAEIMGKSIALDAVIKKALETWADPTGEHLIGLMDEAGIDVTVICLVDNADIPGVTPESIQRANKILGDIASRYPHRIIPFAGVDPRRPEARDMLQQCFLEFGVKGLKYHPDHGYDPGGPESYKLLEILVAHKGILLTHTGPLPPPARCRFAEPALLADLAVDFPELPVIAAHMGAIDWRSWANLAAHQPNLYGDLAMWDAYAFGRYELFCRELRDILDYAGASKVLFGTDNPIFNTIEPTRNWIRLLKDLPSNAPKGISFTEAEIDAILGGNAASILGLG